MYTYMLYTCLHAYIHAYKYTYMHMYNACGGVEPEHSSHDGIDFLATTITLFWRFHADDDVDLSDASM